MPLPEINLDDRQFEDLPQAQHDALSTMMPQSPTDRPLWR